MDAKETILEVFADHRLISGYRFIKPERVTIRALDMQGGRRPIDGGTGVGGSRVWAYPLF